MEFKLILCARAADELILYAEKPIAGLKFLEVAGQCLRRNLDGQSKTRHQTLGNIATYEISVPQAIAIESGWFEQKNIRYLPCEANVLEKYIFYGAFMSSSATNRAVYPYYSNEIVLASYIDELALLDVWRTRGFPKTFYINLNDGFDGSGDNLPLVPDADEVEGPSTGDIVLDDLLNDTKTYNLH